MLLITCPHCGPRAELEYAYAGEAHIARPVDPMSLDDESWTRFLYHRANPKGLHTERWRHLHGCGRFFNVLRDTISDTIVTTYPAGEPRPAIPSDGKETTR